MNAVDLSSSLMIKSCLKALVFASSALTHHRLLQIHEPFGGLYGFNDISFIITTVTLPLTDGWTIWGHRTACVANVESL